MFGQSSAVLDPGHRRLAREPGAPSQTSIPSGTLQN